MAMCPVCLATMGLYVAGGVSAGGITTYLAARVLRGRRKQHESITPTETPAALLGHIDEHMRSIRQTVGL